MGFLFVYPLLCIFFRREGNPRLCLNTTCASDGEKSRLGLIVGVLGGLLLAVVTVLGIVLCICRRRRAKPNTTSPSLLNQSGKGFLLPVRVAQC